MAKRLSKAAKTMQMAAALIKQYGGDAQAVKAVEEAEQPLRHWRNDDAVVELAKTPKRFIMRRCRNCGMPFGHNKPIPVGDLVGLCSDPCRREDWFKTTGLPYSALSISDPWDGDPPMIIRPDQIENLRALAEWFTTNETLLQERATEPEPDPMDVRSLPVVEDVNSPGIVVGDFSGLESTSQDQDASQTIPDFSLDDEDFEQIGEEVSTFEL